jgi:hypothetical protein
MTNGNDRGVTAYGDDAVRRPQQVLAYGSAAARQGAVAQAPPPKRPPSARPHILIHRSSTLSAETLLRMIKGNKNFPGFLKPHLSVAGNRIQMRPKAPATPPDTFSTYLQPFHHAFVAREWELTTADSTISIQLKADEALVLKNGQPTREYIQPITPHLAKGELIGEWFESSPGERSFTPWRIEQHDRTRSMVIFGWTLGKHLTSELRSKRGLIILVSRMRVIDSQGRTHHFIPTDDEIVETFMHEIAAHAGLMSQGKPGTHGTQPTEFIADEIARFFRRQGSEVVPKATATAIFQLLD